ncbi:MAG: acylphosphatase [Candidatus Sumerlaeia bacterium]|nr:acylphosphatase [Candidatus Sumerlaeia bacterium]
MSGKLEKETDEVNCFHGVVEGRVQRVGFRVFTREAARRHGIKGWVRNLPNGCVELHAVGDEISLTEFLTEVYQGPVLSHVSHIELKWQTSEEEFGSFDILR